MYIPFQFLVVVTALLGFGGYVGLDLHAAHFEKVGYRKGEVVGKATEAKRHEEAQTKAKAAAEAKEAKDRELRDTAVEHARAAGEAHVAEWRDYSSKLEKLWREADAKARTRGKCSAPFVPRTVAKMLNGG